jgi:hypothetical protein
MIDDSQLNQKNPRFEELISLFKERRVLDLHKMLEHLFGEFYQNAGYTFHESAPLISEEDNSVLFTGAFISAVKDILLSGNYGDESSGIYMRQECLRTQDFKHAFENGFIPLGQTYFNMIGILSKPGRFNAVCAEAIDFTVNKLGIEAYRVKIKSTKLYDELDDIRVDSTITVEYDTEPESYYWWNYGIDGVHGEGITLCVLNPATNEWWDVGNIVKIVNNVGSELGTEFGYGNEFLLSATIGVAEPLRLSQVFEIFEYESGLSQKYFAYLEAMVRMKNAGVMVGDHKTNHIYKQYLKSIQYIGSCIGKSIEEILSDIIIFERGLGITDSDFGKEIAFMQDHENKRRGFSGLVKRVGKHLWDISKGRTPKETMSDPEGMLKNYLITNGIDINEVKDDLERLRRFNVNFQI